MARNYRPKQQPEEREEGSGERDQHRDRRRRRRRDFSRLRNEGGGVPKAAIFVTLGLLALFALGFTARLASTVLARWAIEGHGPEFEATVEDSAQELFRKWRAERGSLTASEELALMTEARVTARRLQTYLVRSMKIGRELGAPDEVRKVVFMEGWRYVKDGGDVTDDHIRAMYYELMRR